MNNTQQGAMAIGLAILLTLLTSHSALAQDEGEGFFDLEKIQDAQTLTFRGYLDAEFVNAQGEGRPGVPSFDQASIGFYIGAPIYQEKVYASLGIEFFNQSRAFAGLGRRLLVLEEAQIALTPVQGLTFAFGGFLVPFGVEDGRHASVVNPLITRPEPMAGGAVYPGSWSDIGMRASWRLDAFGTLEAYTVNGDLVNQRLAIQTALGTSQSALSDAETKQDELHVFGFTAPADSNSAKSYGGRVSMDRLLDGVNFGGSGVWGHFDEEEERATWAAGSHLELDLSLVAAPLFGEVLPLPTLLVEYVRVFEESPDQFVEKRDRWRWGVYGQAVQPLVWDVSAVLRYEFFDPDTDTFDDEAQAFGLGLLWEVYPNTLAKAEYRIRDENQPDEIDNNLFALQIAVGW